MGKIFFLTLLVLYSITLKAQHEVMVSIDTAGRTQATKVFVSVEQQPSFPGGKEGLIEFYNEVSLLEICSGGKSCKTVYSQMIVDSLGGVCNFKIIRGVNKKFDEETERIVKLMPKWKPGLMKGKPVNVLVTLDIKYASDE